MHGLNRLLDISLECKLEFEAHGYIPIAIRTIDMCQIQISGHELHLNVFTGGTEARQAEFISRCAASNFS